MNNQTKILVIHMKELVIGLIVAVALIVMTILAIACFGGKSKDSQTQSSKTTSNSSITNSTSSNTSGSKSPGSKSSASGGSSVTYSPGVYTSSISVNGTPVEIKVTVDETNINAIELNNLSDSITTMYPMMQTSFDALAEQVISHGSTENINYEAESKYTSTMLLQGIQQALDKCTQ